MFPSERQALRALLASMYNRSDRLRAAEMEAITADILRESKVLASHTSLQWNNRHATPRFPPEILCLCFSYLSLNGRVSASHVSQAWRAAAVGNPLLWTDIWCSQDDPTPSAWLLNLSMSRAGDLPIRLCLGEMLIRGVEHVLHESAHRIAFVSVRVHTDKPLLEIPCPLLHSLHLWGRVIISDQFFGKVVGRLTELRTRQLDLLVQCRALTTITTVEFTTCAAGSLGRLFASCPRLKSLSITDLQAPLGAVHWFPPGSLKDLVLCTRKPHIELTSLFNACDRAAKLQSVDLRPGPFSERLLLARAVFGAVSLDIQLLPDESVSITVHLAGNRRLTVFLDAIIQHYRAAGRTITFPPVFRQDAASFAQLRSVSLPLIGLPAFVADAPPLPVLETLCIRVPEEHNGGVPELALLRHLVKVRGCHVVLDVPRPDYGPERHAKSIISALASVAEHLRVTVRGFSPGIVSVPSGLHFEFE